MRSSQGAQAQAGRLQIVNRSKQKKQGISVALQRAVAYNALDFRYTKLVKGRVVGGGSGSGNAALAQQLLAQLANDLGADGDEEPEAQPALAAAVAGVGVLCAIGDSNLKKS